MLCGMFIGHDWWVRCCTHRSICFAGSVVSVMRRTLLFARQSIGAFCTAAILTRIENATGHKARVDV